MSPRLTTATAILHTQQHQSSTQSVMRWETFRFQGPPLARCTLPLQWVVYLKALRVSCCIMRFIETLRVLQQALLPLNSPDLWCRVFFNIHAIPVTEETPIAQHGRSTLLIRWWVFGSCGGDAFLCLSQPVLWRVEVWRSGVCVFNSCFQTRLGCLWAGRRNVTTKEGATTSTTTPEPLRGHAPRFRWKWALWSSLIYCRWMICPTHL